MSHNFLLSNKNDNTFNQLALSFFFALLLSFLLTAPLQANAQNHVAGNRAPEGTPVVVVQKAIEALYNGDITAAASYYYIEDIPNFESELEEIQPVFAQTVQSISMSEIFYDNTGNKAVIVGTIKLKDPATNQQQNDSVLYKLIKINGDWKIVN